MPNQATPATQVMEVILRSPGCLMDDVVLECPDLTWNQVFSALDRMSRNGEITLTWRAPGKYEVRQAQAPKRCA